jgi:hypothetical protein
MAGSIRSWPRLYQQALQNLNPNGWIEIQEFDVWFYSQVSGGLSEDSSIMKWQKMIDQGSQNLGRQLNYASKFAKQLEDAGFVDVQTQVIKVCSYFHVQRGGVIEQILDTDRHMA